MQKLNNNAHRGFSMLELLAVIAVLSILVAITITRIAESSGAAKEKACFHNRGMINSALERFAVGTGSAPTAISDINTADYFPSGVPVCPVTGNAYTFNATTQRVDGHTTSGAVPGDH